MTNTNPQPEPNAASAQAQPTAPKQEQSAAQTAQSTADKSADKSGGKSDGKTSDNKSDNKTPRTISISGVGDVEIAHYRIIGMTFLRRIDRNLVLILKSVFDNPITSLSLDDVSADTVTAINEYLNRDAENAEIEDELDMASYRNSSADNLIKRLKKDLSERQLSRLQQLCRVVAKSKPHIKQALSEIKRKREQKPNQTAPKK